jgi:PAS domain S-box-containing protein
MNSRAEILSCDEHFLEQLGTFLDRRSSITGCAIVLFDSGVNPLVRSGEGAVGIDPKKLRKALETQDVHMQGFFTTDGDLFVSTLTLEDGQDLYLVVRGIDSSSEARLLSEDAKQFIQALSSSYRHERVREELETLLGLWGAGRWYYDLNTGENPVDENWKKLFGVPDDTSIRDFGRYFMSRIHPEDRSRVKQAMDDVLTYRSDVYHSRFRFDSELKGELWIEGIGTSGKERSQLFGLNIDITDLMRKQLEVEKTSSLLRSVIDHLPSGVFWKDTDSVYLGANDVFAHDTGVHSYKDLIGKTDKDLPLVSDEHDYFREIDLEVMKTGKPKLNVPTVLHHMDDEDGWGYTSKVPLFDQQQHVYGVLGVYTDITELKKTEERLRNREQRLQAIFSSSSDLIILLDADKQVEFVSPSVRTLLSLDDISDLQRVLPASLTEGSRNQLLETLEQLSDADTQSSARLSVQVIDASSKKHSCDLTLDVLHDEHQEITGFLLIGRDMTDQLALQQQLQRSQKMEAVGRLAAGIAHDFNNVLQGILGYSDLLQLYLEQDSNAYELTQSLKEAAGEAERLISQLFRFSRMEEQQSTEILCSNMISDLLPMLKTALGSRATIVLDTRKAISPIRGNRMQLEELIVSMCMFIWDLSGHQGTIDITTEEKDQTPEKIQDNIRSRGDVYVCITFASGSETHTDPIEGELFDPFSSPGASQAGLRLAFAYSIVRDHKGFLTKTSASPSYTVWLPARIS